MLAPALVIAAPTMGTWLTTQSIGATQNLRTAWGDVSNSGWKKAPAGVVTVPDGDVQHPLCLPPSSWSQRAGQGWVGLARAQFVNATTTQLECNFHNGSASVSATVTDGGTVFTVPSNRPAPKWLGTTASTPEPFGAIRLLTQETSRRPIYACVFPHEGRTAAGYIGDDGKCYGATRTGVQAGGSAYQVLVTDTSAGSSAPRYGWVPGGPGYVPHGTLAQATQPNIPSASSPIVRTNPKTRTVCRVQESGSWWPGYLSPYGGCDYFTYFNNATQRKNSSSFEVFRMGPGENQVDVVFGTNGGKSFRSCVAYKANIPDETVWGFSSNTTACTDGTHTSSSSVNVLDLPRVNADRG